MKTIIGSKTYDLPAVAYTSEGEYIAITNIPVKGKEVAKVYNPNRDTHKNITADELNNISILRYEKPLDLKVNDCYSFNSGKRAMKFTVVSVNDNDLQLKCEGTGKNTIVTSEFNVVEFSAFIKNLEQQGIPIASGRNSSNSNTKKYLIIGGIVLAIATAIVVSKK
jgi:hypothetical protein